MMMAPRLGANPHQSELTVENRRARHEETLAAEHAGKPSADGQHYRVGYEIRGKDPGALVSARSKIAADVGKRNVGDACVENLHELFHSDYDADQPRVELRLPLGDTTGAAASTDCVVFANGASALVELVAITLKQEKKCRGFLTSLHEGAAHWEPNRALYPHCTNP